MRKLATGDHPIRGSAAADVRHLTELTRCGRAYSFTGRLVHEKGRTMRARLLVGALAMVAMVVGLAVPAYAMTAKTVLEASMQEVLEPTGTRVGTLHGATVVESQHYCEQKRKIELFLDGKKIGSTESDRYGGWFFSLKPLESGRYVAKTKKSRLSGMKGVFCSAAQTKPLIVL
jgi:hypothetical protein